MGSAMLGALVWEAAPNSKGTPADASHIHLLAPLLTLIWGAPMKMLLPKFCLPFERGNLRPLLNLGR
jgi:hypothetical protein